MAWANAQELWYLSHMQKTTFNLSPHRDAFYHILQIEQTQKYDPTLVALTSNFLVLCTIVEVYS